MAKAIKSPFQMLRRDVEVKIGVITVSVGIAGASVQRKILTVFIFVGKFFCAKKKHVLKKMSNTWNLPGI